jgi:tetratricopeptide (TPR) repeat protein
MIEQLGTVLDRDPSHARANLRMALLQLRQFDSNQQRTDTPMALAQIRDAALVSDFPDRRTQDLWVSRVTGDNRQFLDRALACARRAVQLCPLQGEGYVYLAELAFLDGGGAARKQAYIDQALRVRPYSGVVLLAAGAEAALAGQEDRALELYRRAFHQEPEQRRRVIQLVASQVPADVFVAEFHPDGEALDELFTFYRHEDRPDDARTVGRQLVESLRRRATHRTGRSAARTWERSAEIQLALGDVREAAESLRNSLFHAPEHFERHHRLARLLLESGQFDAAIAELQWCLRRKPNHPQLCRQLESARRQRLSARVTRETR